MNYKYGTEHMKTKIYLFLFLSIFVFDQGFSQSKQPAKKDSAFFNYSYWNGVADKENFTPAERAEMISGQKKIFLEMLEEQEHNHSHKDEDLIWISEPSPKKGYSSGTTNAGPCTNIDFEQGNFNGWTRSAGFNPLVNTAGCCNNPNGDQTIMTGGGNDPYGGFPVVYPGGGNFSLRLGSTTTGGRADRISQTFFVTPQNANFTYHYAVVLNDGGHNLIDQPYFISEIIDSLGNPINCTTYMVSAGSGVTGYSTSTSNANGGPVIYRPWSSVAVDLTPNIGQNVTLRFTVYDCRQTGHFAYAYVDGLCTSFETATSDTTCPNVPTTICAPAGFSTTIWNGPGVVNDPNQCISVSIPGEYTCTTILGPGCPGPTFQHTLNVHPSPVLSFTPVTTGVCATQYTFNPTMSISSGAITSYTWSFGDGNTSTAQNPSHNYATAGTYSVMLKARSNRGCLDSIVDFITIFPLPNLIFSPPSNCINTVVQFSNNSTINVGSITGYTWDLGNGTGSNTFEPTNTYSTNGTYTITLSAISNQGCSSTLSQTLGIFPPPVIGFSASPLCDMNGTAFSPFTATAIASGSLAIFNWDFGDGNTSNQANPVHIYSGPGVYTVNFTAISNHNCSASTSDVLTISPTPTVAFATTSINACSPHFTFTNQSAISTGPITYTWSFGGTNTTTAISPSYTFPSIGDYTVRLIGRSNMGCADTAVQHISVYPYPVIHFSVPASCENAIFTVSTTASSGSVTSYAWDFGDPASGPANTSTLQNPTHYYASTNVYTINLNIVSNLNCPSSYSTQITVFPNPVAAFSYSTLNNCSLPYAYVNSSSVSAIGSSSLSSFLWDFGGAATSTLQNPGTVSFPGNGHYPTSLIVTTNHNCSDTMTADILVHPIPVVDFSVNPTCVNQAVTFTTASSISPIPLAASTITNYVWNYGDGTFTSSATPPPHNYGANGTYTLTFSGTSDMGCSASISKTVAIHPVPILSFTTTGNMCLGNTTQFTSTSSISSGTIFSLNWNFGDGGIGSNQSTTHTYSNSGSFPVTFSATTNYECTSILIQTVTVHPLPIVSFTTNGGCLNSVSIFNESSTVTPGSITSYSWNFGDGNSANSQTANHTYTSYATFTPSLTITSDQGCVNTGTTNLTIFPLPTVSFSPSGACVSSAVQFTNTSSIPVGTISSFVWDFSDGSPQVNAMAPSHTYNMPGTYVVTVTATSNEGCVRTATNNLAIYPYPSVSITPINSSCINELVTIYPNVTITGSNNPVTGYTLSFGDGSPAFTSTSAIQYTVPHLYTGYNTYTVSLAAVSNGCISHTTTTVRVYPKPFPNFVPSDFCLNSPTQFVNTSTIAATYSIQAHQWNFGDGAVPPSTLQNTAHIFSSPGVFSVTLTEYTHPEPGLTCSLSAMRTITINPLPVPSFTSNSVCAGVATSFTNTTPPISTSQTVSGWSWSFYSNNQTNTILQNPSHTYSASGTHTATLKVVNTFGCRDSIQHTVNVWAIPSVSFTANNVCLNAATNFTETSTISDPLSNTLIGWVWNFGDNSSPDSRQNPDHTYANFGTFHPTLTVTSNRGCVGHLTQSVTVHPQPIVSFSPPGACVNSTIQFTNTSTIPLGSITSYLWDFNDSSPTSSVVSPSHTYSTPAVYVVTLTATSNQGCVRNYTNNFSIYPYPTITVPPLSNACVSNSILIDPNVSITGNNNTISGYTVSFGDGSPAHIASSPSQYSVSHAYNAYNAYTVTIHAVSNGCTSSSQVPILIYPNPVTSFTSSRYCANEQTSFVNTSTIAPGGLIGDYLWQFGPGAPTSTLSNPSHQFLSLGIHQVSLTTFSYPEPGLTCSTTAVRNITINPLPQQVAFTTNSVCLGRGTQFTNTTPSVGITGWSWHTNNQLFSGAHSPTYTYSSSGKFLATLVAQNSFGCRDTVRDSVTVYSNPTASFVTNNVCSGRQSLFLDQSVTGHGSMATYTWNTNGNMGFSNDQNAVFQYGGPGTYTVQLMAGNTLGCIGRYTSTVTIYPLPTINFMANEVCQNNPTQFTNMSSITSGGISSYTWTFANPSAGSNSVSTLVHPTHTFPGSGSFAAPHEAVSDHNCVSPPKIMNVRVRANPKAAFSHTTICVSDPTAFTNLSSSSDGTLTNHYWDFNGDNITDLDNKTPVYSYSISGNYNARLTVRSQFGCIDTVSHPVIAHPKALAAIGSNLQNGCPPLCVNFRNLSTIETGSFTTSWDFGDGTPASSFFTPSHCFESGRYDISLTLVSDIGCVTRFTHPGFVTVSPVPRAGFRVEPEEGVDEDEPIISVSSEASSDVNFVRYYISDGSSYGTSNFTHYVKNLKDTKPMVVQIVKNPSGCTDTTYQVLNIKPAYVIYFPDAFTPNGDGINDDFRPKGVGISKFNMQIFDRWGHQVFHTNEITDTWDGRSKNGNESIKQDVYTWKAQVTDIFNKNHFLVGRVTVIR
jgi:gliding motility-associated-like protein